MRPILLSLSLLCIINFPAYASDDDSCSMTVHHCSDSEDSSIDVCAYDGDDGAHWVYSEKKSVSRGSEKSLSCNHKNCDIGLQQADTFTNCLANGSVWTGLDYCGDLYIQGRKETKDGYTYHYYGYSKSSCSAITDMDKYVSYW